MARPPTQTMPTTSPEPCPPAQGASALHIRHATEADLPALIELIRQLNAPGAAQTEASISTAFRAIGETPNHHVFVTEVDGAVVGTYALIVIQQLSHTGGRSAIVEDVVVRSDQQGRGIGQAMMQHAADQARAHSCYKIVLSSGKARQAAHAFYRKLGFQDHGSSFLLPLVP